MCFLDQGGTVLFDRNLPCHFKTLLEAIAPFRDDLVIGVECMFGWSGACAKRRMSVSCQLSIVSCQLSVVRGPWSVVSGPCLNAERRHARDERQHGCCKKANVGDIDPAMHPCAMVPDLVAWIGPRRGSAVI